MIFNSVERLFTSWIECVCWRSFGWSEIDENFQCIPIHLLATFIDLHTLHEIITKSFHDNRSSFLGSFSKFYLCRIRNPTDFMWTVLEGKFEDKNLLEAGEKKTYLPHNNFSWNIFGLTSRNHIAEGEFKKQINTNNIFNVTLEIFAHLPFSWVHAQWNFCVGLSCYLRSHNKLMYIYTHQNLIATQHHKSQRKRKQNNRTAKVFPFILKSKERIRDNEKGEKNVCFCFIICKMTIWKIKVNTKKTICKRKFKKKMIVNSFLTFFFFYHFQKLVSYLLLHIINAHLRNKFKAFETPHKFMQEVFLRVAKASQISRACKNIFSYNSHKICLNWNLFRSAS